MLVTLALDIPDALFAEAKNVAKLEGDFRHIASRHGGNVRQFTASATPGASDVSRGDEAVLLFGVKMNFGAHFGSTPEILRTDILGQARAVLAFTEDHLARRGWEPMYRPEGVIEGVHYFAGPDFAGVAAAISHAMHLRSARADVRDQAAEAQTATGQSSRPVARRRRRTDAPRLAAGGAA
jgi:hypothetical protein